MESFKLQFYAFASISLFSISSIGCSKDNGCSRFRSAASLCEFFPAGNCEKLLDFADDEILNGIHYYPVPISNFILPSCMPTCESFHFKVNVEMIDSLSQMSLNLIVKHGAVTDSIPLMKEINGVYLAEYTLDIPKLYGNLDQLCFLNTYLTINFKSTGSYSKDKEDLLTAWKNIYVEWEEPRLK